MKSPSNQTTLLIRSTPRIDGLPVQAHAMGRAAWVALACCAGAAAAQAQNVFVAPAPPRAAPNQAVPGLGLPNPAGLSSPLPSPAGLPPVTVPNLASPGSAPGSPMLQPGAQVITPGAVVPGAVYIDPTAPVAPAPAAGGTGASGAATALPTDPGMTQVTALQMAQIFRKADANQDGQLTRAEALQLELMPMSFEDMDRNKDGFVSRSEFEDAFR